MIMRVLEQNQSLYKDFKFTSSNKGILPMPVGFNKMGNVVVITFKLGWYFRTQTYLLGGGSKNMQKADKMLRGISIS